MGGDFLERVAADLAHFEGYAAALGQFGQGLFEQAQFVPDGGGGLRGGGFVRDGLLAVDGAGFHYALPPLAAVAVDGELVPDAVEIGERLGQPALAGHGRIAPPGHLRHIFGGGRLVRDVTGIFQQLWPVRHKQPERLPAQGAGAGDGAACRRRAVFFCALCRSIGLESGMLHLIMYALPA